ncbi:MAG: Tetratricopeptide repeat-like domain [Acidobacteriota bacterium]|nr:Tetratricopeptide repeat-like domain [Acidobacteriota bacterium]
MKRDRFREETLGLFEKLGDRLEGRGKTLLYGLVGLVLAAALAYAFVSWRESKANEARQALGRAIDITESPVATASPAPAPQPGRQIYASEKERAQRAADEFQKVADKYGDPYRSQANYFKATNLLVVDHAKGLSELEALTKNGNREVSTWAKFALAQAHEADGNYDAAVALYKDLVSARDNAVIPADTLNLRLASCYEKQGKKSEAAEILFQIVKASREAKDKNGKFVAPSSAAHDAEQKLEQLDPARHAQLPPEPPRDFSS